MSHLVPVLLPTNRDLALLSIEFHVKPGPNQWPFSKVFTVMMDM